MGGLSEIPSGPFYIGPTIRNGNPAKGLLFIGVPEQCDRCKEIYPMSWIEFDGEHFLCTACSWDVHVEHKDMEIAVAENLDLIECCGTCFKYGNINEMTISYNQLICRKCANKLYQERLRDEERAELERQKKELTEALEREKHLSPEERMQQEMERTKAYYDRICN
jgi:hypothetical protein